MLIEKQKQTEFSSKPKLPAEWTSFPELVVVAGLVAAAEVEVAGWVVGTPCLLFEAGIRSPWSTAPELRGPSSQSSSEPDRIVCRTSRPASSSSVLRT